LLGVAIVFRSLERRAFSLYYFLFTKV